MAIKTSIDGFFQADIIVRTALIAAFRDLRANPWLFDFIFAGLINDPLTRAEYGEIQLNEARQWFMNNDIPVVWVSQPDFSIPRVTIIPLGTSEQSQTLADIHYDPTELVDSSTIVAIPYPTVGPFTPASYDPLTGTVTLPANMNTDSVFAGMLLVDKTTNTTYPIVDVIDDQSFLIEPQTVANFTQALVAPASNLYMARLESLEHQEAFKLEGAVNGNPVLSIYLHAILQFCVNRYKQEFFEARGFERTTCTSGPAEIMRGADAKEIIYLRSVTMTGATRNSWPKSVKPLIQGVRFAMSVDSNVVSTTDEEDGDGWSTNDSEG